MKTLAERQAICRAVLTAPVEKDHTSLARELGTTREAVRRIRLGQAHANICPEIERIDPAALTRTCLQCNLFKLDPYRLKTKNGSGTRIFGRCTIGIPEAANINFARGCGAFVKA